MWRDPFGPPSPNLPPGDTHIVYPGKEGPLSSIRFDMMRAGLEDYEKLLVLTQETQKAAKQLGQAAADVPARERSDEICNQLVHSLTDCVDSPSDMDRVSRLLDDECVAMLEEPLFVMKCDPPAGTELVPGPMVVHFFGATRKGAKLRCNGQPMTVTSNGRFSFSMGPDAKGEIHFTVEWQGRKKTFTRRFRIRGEEK